MLLWLTEYLSNYYSVFHVFSYLTLRAIVSVLTAFAICLVFGPKMIALLSQSRLGQVVRDDGPASHFSKKGTPTMGGGLILFSIVLTVLLWANLNNRFIGLMIIMTLAFASIGFLDDYRKIILNHSKGLRAKYKYLLQSIFALMAASFLYYQAQTPVETQLIVPFFKNIALDLGFFYIIWVYFVIVGTSNAVNLTDGLDGLAILPVVLVGGALGIFAYVAGHSEFAHYLAVPFVKGAGELTIFCAALVGAGLGFLWFNTYPAQVFMGDVGALALGAAIGLLATIVRQELVLVIMGGVFVMETISVILQVASFKLTGKRIFKMAPIHHHFELKGWPEPKVIVRFWIITVMLVLCGLATLKLR